MCTIPNFELECGQDFYKIVLFFHILRALSDEEGEVGIGQASV